MAISHYLKEIGRGARGAKALDREQATDLFGQILDGGVSDLETGAFCIAMRIKGETLDEMSGFIDATHARIPRFQSAGRPIVVLPSYNGARKLPVLTPLLALLLAREGLPVLLHGMRTEARRVLASDVLAALGIAPGTAARTLDDGEVTHMDTRHLHPGLARLLAARELIGLRNPAHSVVKLINPADANALVISSYTHPEYFDTLGATYHALGMNGLLSRGLEGEVAADPRRTPRYDGFVRGRHQLLQSQGQGTASEVPGLPTEIDVATTARYTEQVLGGRLPVPEALAAQVQFIVRIAQQVTQEPLPSCPVTH
ncbi:DNA-binding protein YbiB [Diaphorobacter ruginosibacter]|uniref:DNA-binding protein YbiB n=1 Tax=Diaphorobacter ruginosibacter TaxID=1715720 RepID=A0A7G9RSK0_9BURK|nr:DNA-binding protein YbiB [Diaphorobacter ruginosibacter]QNN58575.1 DNA-binding protein YbiB [Diaphorobacter ruginosibacter]